MPSDTLLSKLVMESPTDTVVDDRTTAFAAAASYLVICGFIADAILCAAVMLSSLLLRPAHLYETHTLVAFAAASGLCAALLLQSDHHRLSPDEARPVLHTAAAIRITIQTLLLLLPCSILCGLLPQSSVWFALFAIPIALTLERRAMDAMWRTICAGRTNTARVVLLGPIAIGKRLAAKLMSSPGIGLTPVALIDDRETNLDELHCSDYRGLPVLSTSPTGSILRSLQCDLLVIANTEPNDNHADDAVMAASEIGARVTLLPRSDWFDDFLETHDRIGGQLFAEADVTWYYPPVKRSFDFLLSCLFLVVLSPVLLAVALIIRMESPGPALFIQERIGARGTRFSMYKFRSMTCNVEPYERSPILSEDPRITRIGRFLRRTSLDELPQLFNVFLGQMSLVGPRPEMAFIVSAYSAHQRLRLQVIPGITGLWQLSKDRAYPIHENIHHDLTYIRRRSISLDLAILIHTLFFAMRGGI